MRPTPWIKRNWTHDTNSLLTFAVGGRSSPRFGFSVIPFSVRTAATGVMRYVANA